LGNDTAKQLQLKFGESKVSFVHCDVADEEMFTGWWLDLTSSSHLSKCFFEILNTLMRNILSKFYVHYCQWYFGSNLTLVSLLCMMMALY